MNKQNTPLIQKTETIFTSFVRITMYILIAIYPFGMAAYQIYQNNRGLMNFEDKILVGTIVLFIFCSCVVLWKIVSRKVSNFQIIGICLLLYFLSFSVRVVAFSLLQTVPISDFNECYKYAASIGGDQNFLAEFPYLGSYALTLKLFFRFVYPSVFNAQLLNALVTACIPCFIFLGINRITKRTNAAIVGALSYALFPSMIVYCAVPSCEHFAQFFLSIFVCFIAFYYSETKPTKRCIYAILVGISLGLTCVYKELFIIIAPSFLMASFCFECTPVISAFIRKKASKRHLYNLIYIVVLDILILVVSLGVTNTVVRVAQVELVGTSFSREAPLSATIYEGLCFDGQGVWNPEVKKFVSDAMNNADSPEDVDEVLYTALYEDYVDNPGALLELIHEKFVIDWCEEEVYYYWTFTGETNILQGYWLGELLFNVSARAWFMTLSVTICVGCIISLWRKDSSYERQYDFIVTGIVFLFAIALILLEAQGRYKSNISPLICVMFSLCLVRFLDTANLLYHNIVNRIKRSFR